MPSDHCGPEGPHPTGSQAGALTLTVRPRFPGLSQRPQAEHPPRAPTPDLTL